MGGPQFTIADIHHLPYMAFLADIGEASMWKGLSNVDRWYKEISERDTWMKVRAEEMSNVHKKSVI